MRRTFGHLTMALAEAGIIAMLVIGLIAAPALAGKGGGNGKGPGKPSGGTSSLTLVMVDPADAAPNHGDVITFDVSTTATDRPFVAVNCYQGGAHVYSASVGYFPDYPWSQTFTLSASSWPSGAADCVATLYSSRDGSRTTTLATLSFAVAP